MLGLSKLNPIRHILRWVIVGFFGSTILAVVALRFIPVYFTPLMFIRCAQQIGQGKDLKLKHHWVPIDKISSSMPVAVMASEDQKFLLHHGFDLESIEKAATHNQHKKRVRGASTISQQTAKNIFLWPGRSWVRKGFEAYFTVLIEFMWSKQRIMECYLNSIEMGDGIYGVDAVAKDHFNTDAANLTRSDCALIAATLPNPIKFNSARLSTYIRNRQGKIMHEMKFIPEFPREGEYINPETTVGGVYHKKRH